MTTLVDNTSSFRRINHQLFAQNNNIGGGPSPEFLTTTVTKIDVINGRGMGVQKHDGNIFFRKFVCAHKKTYAQAPKADKVKISKGVVEVLRQFGSRFLEFDINTGCWNEIGDEKALSKTSQALREGQTKIKQELATACSFDESNTSTEESCVKLSTQIMQLLRREEGNTIMMADTNTTEPEQKMLPRPTLSHHRSVSARVLREFLNDVGVGSERFSEIGTDGQRLPSDRISGIDMNELLNEEQFAAILDEMTSSASGFDFSGIDDNEERISLMSLEERISLMSLDARSSTIGNIEAV